MKIKNITEFKSSKWSGGTTTELFIYPETACYTSRDFLFRLSSATVDEERSVFTNLQGFKRFIAPIDGELNISHDEKDFKPLSKNELYAFDGGIKTVSTGRCRDFNLMVKHNVEACVKTCTLNENKQLTIELLQNEILWLFLYRNLCNVKINCNNKLLVNSELKQMNLLILKPEQSDNKQNEIGISTDKTSDLFYGKVCLSYPIG